MTPNCFNGFVGISDKPSKCISASVDNSSSTGLYITQDEAYEQSYFQSGDTNCDLIGILVEMREEAYRKLAMDLGALMVKKLQLRAAYQYNIGQPAAGPFLQNAFVPTSPFILIHTDYRPGAHIEIKKIALMLGKVQTGSFDTDLRLVREWDNMVLNTWKIANITGLNTTAREVKPYMIPCDGQTYRVEYDFNPLVMRVPDTDYHCNCGDVLKQAVGFIKRNEVKSYGISLYTEMACGYDQIVCSLVNSEPYRTVLAYMVRKKTIAETLRKIYYRQDVNRFTLLSSEDRSAQITAYETEYNERLRWLDVQKNFTTDGFCVSCGDSGMQKLNLLTGR